MSRDGLVIDLESKADRRQRIVAITPEGRTLWLKASRDYQKRLRQLEELLTEKEKRATEDVLVRLSTEASKLFE